MTEVLKFEKMEMYGREFLLKCKYSHEDSDYMMDFELYEDEYGALDWIQPEHEPSEVMNLVFKGSARRGGCSHVSFIGDEVYRGDFHFCGWEDFETYATILNRIAEIGKEIHDWNEK